MTDWSAFMRRTMNEMEDRAKAYKSYDSNLKALQTRNKALQKKVYEQGTEIMTLKRKLRAHVEREAKRNDKQGSTSGDAE